MRFTRKMALKKNFEKEKSRMAGYYMEKSKKNKKFKTLLK